MYNYELLPKLRHLALVGQNEEGDLEWIGEGKDWAKAEEGEKLLINEIINNESNARF